MIRFLYKYQWAIGLVAVFVFWFGATSVSAQAQNFSLTPYGPQSLTDLLNVIITWVFNIAIPIAVIMIIWAGITLLTSRGDPGKVKKGQDILKYAVIGLVIIFIGKGFISLIKSILELAQ